MSKKNTQRCWYQHEHFLATILETGAGGGGGGATGRLQGFMTNQFSKKNGIVLVY